MMNVSKFMAIDFLQEPERHRFDLLPHIVERVARVFAESPFDERSSDIQAAFAAADDPGRGGREFVDRGLLFVAADFGELGDLDRDHLDLLRREHPHHLGGFLLRQAGEQHGGFAKISHRGAHWFEQRSHQASTPAASRGWRRIAATSAEWLLAALAERIPARRKFRRNCLK